MNRPQQPEPCLGGPGTHDRDGHCHSVWACSAFGFCRERATKIKRTPTLTEELQWKLEAQQRAEADQYEYLDGLKG